ncbi:hypothetical protein GEMRC1_002103 [Eukaryota sp. GEM-RC1]
MQSKRPRPKRDPSGGRLIKDKTTKPKYILPSAYRNDPSLKPPLPKEETTASLLSLVERGLVTNDNTLASTISLRPRKVALLDPSVSQRREKVSDSSFGLDFSSFKLDLTTPRYPASAPSRSSITPSDTVASVSSCGHFPELPTNFKLPPKPHSAASAKPSRKSPRDYNQIMDDFDSKTLILRNGKPVETPEYEAFHRVYLSIWKDVERLLNVVGQFCVSNGIATAFVDTRELVKLTNKIGAGFPLLESSF